MKKMQSGFTLIELVMVIVILGILAASALPKFVDLSGQAQDAAIEGVAGAFASGSAINYASCSVGGTCTTTNTCRDFTGLVNGVTTVAADNPATDGEYVLPDSAGSAVNGTQFTCTITLDASTTTADFAGIAAGN